jgi:hypothetical protein
MGQTPSDAGLAASHDADQHQGPSVKRGHQTAGAIRFDKLLHRGHVRPTLPRVSFALPFPHPARQAFPRSGLPFPGAGDAQNPPFFLQASTGLVKTGKISPSF